MRDWLYVEDHCAAMETVMLKGVAGETYCVGGDNERKNLDLVDLLCDLVDAAPGPPRGHQPEALQTFVKDRAGHDRRYAIDATEIQHELGWRPGVSFPEDSRARWVGIFGHPFQRISGVKAWIRTQEGPDEGRHPCGGHGTRISEETQARAQTHDRDRRQTDPLAHHEDLLQPRVSMNSSSACGYKGYVIKEYFSNYFLHMSDVTFDLRDQAMEVTTARPSPGRSPWWTPVSTP